MTEGVRIIILVILGIVLCVVVVVIIGFIMYQRNRREMLKQDIHNLDLGIEEETTNGSQMVHDHPAEEPTKQSDETLAITEENELPPTRNPIMIAAVSESATVDLDLDASDMSD